MNNTAIRILKLLYLQTNYSKQTHNTMSQEESNLIFVALVCLSATVAVIYLLSQILKTLKEINSKIDKKDQ